jgi:small-conductance mechanosensitive channel/CRP-like cAMP-binding protein
MLLATTANKATTTTVTTAAIATPLAPLIAIRDEALAQGTPYLLLALVVTLLLMRVAPSVAELRARTRFVLLLVTVHLLLLPATGLADAFEIAMVRDLRLVGSICAALAFVGIAGVWVFGLLLPRLRVSLPRILQDVVIGLLGTLAVFSTASHAGVNLSGIVATGAVLTAVIGLALQDTLGNLVGGLAVQLDSTVRVGDWIRVQEVTGRVVEIRWRSTSIETRNWETVVLPNSVLTRSQVTVLGRRIGQDPRWRRWIYFNVDFRYPPSQVLELVMKTLRTQPITNIAETPAPDCILMDLGESTARYAVRYYLLDFAVDDPTDSVVRNRIYFALRRAEIPLSMPAHAVFLTEDSSERRVHKRAADHEKRVHVLSNIALFRGLSDDERNELASSLHAAPFARGEVLTREGADAHHLYMLHEGTVSVRVRDGDHEREVSQLRRGESFGEMSLLTGEPRAATVVALTDVECYRLDAEAFRGLLARRPDLAEQVAAQLAERRVELVATREQLGDRTSLVKTTERDLLEKIRAFFQL